ncbi:MAG: SGNH/GDSL hydrolase family protein [Acidimicrobiales bacterium]|nr:SGNH/GDSL hydrolase family protein [Acidimicrobiales bacterium]
MSAPERAVTRSRAWLAVPAAPVVVLALLVGGLVAVAVALAVVVQVGLLWERAPAVASATRAALAGGSRWGGRTASLLAFRVLPAVVGISVVLVAFDWGVGALWDRFLGPPEGSVDVLDLATADLPPAEDERAESEAYAGSPWADRYFAELEAVRYTYVPFLGPREQPVRGRHITSAAGERASYEPADATREEAFDVWFFGGSTLWGEGQRDGHTIPSEVARLAESEGVTLRVRNFGERGYTAFQEWLVLEQELARQPAPDLAVFYHGANEIYSLLESPENLGAQPSIYQIEHYREAFDRSPPLPGEQPVSEPSIVDRYRDVGVVDRVVGWLGDQAVPAAQAQPAPYTPSPADQARAIDEAEQIYRRSVRLIRNEADRYGVPSLVFWQPGGEPSTTGPPAAYAELGDRVVEATGSIDISDALLNAPGPVYIDGLHTNELGARLSAEAIWTHLGPELTGDDT